MKIEWVSSPNFWSGRQGRKPIAIVNHITAGLMPGCLSWLQNPQAQASAHYLVTKTGQIFQLVKDEDAAWHAGGVNKPSWPLYDGNNPNLYTIGIEHESKGEALTEAQYQATLWLHRQLMKKWSIPVDRDHVIGHYRIDSVNRPNCPGPNFPWDRLFQDLQGGENVPAEWETKVMEEAEETGLIQPGVHQPGETPTKAFVLAVALNSARELRAENQRLRELLGKAGEVLLGTQK